jgi:hypothetical protein
MDYRPGRINATVENDIVVSYEVEGSGADQEVAGDEQGDPDANRSDNGEERGAAGDNESMADKHDVIIGMTEGEAAAYAEASDVPFRVGVRDGEPLPLTRDYRPGRITAEVEDGLVTGYSVE